MALPTRDEAAQLFKLRRKKYRLTIAEKNILQDIFNDEHLDDSYGVTPLQDSHFNYDKKTGYKQLAEKFREKITASQRYNADFAKKHPILNFVVGFIFRKNTHNLETALTFINYHTYNLIASDRVSTAYDYSKNKSEKHIHKLHTFADNSQYEFSVVNVIHTLAEKSKRFLFVSIGLISRLKDTFVKKIEAVKEYEKKSEFEIKKYDKTTKKFDIAKTLQDIDNNQVSILPQYTANDSDSNTSPRQSASYIRHDNLLKIIATASESDQAINPAVYQSIKECFARLISNEKKASKSYATFFKRKNFVDYAQDIINELEAIIESARPVSNLHQQSKPNNPSSLPLFKQNQQAPIVPETTQNFYDKIIQEAKLDIYAIKAFTSYNKLSDPINETAEQKAYRRKDLTDSIISPVQPIAMR